jgi:hypothetical protein
VAARTVAAADLRSTRCPCSRLHLAKRGRYLLGLQPELGLLTAGIVVAAAAGLASVLVDDLLRPARRRT